MIRTTKMLLQGGYYAAARGDSHYFKEGTVEALFWNLGCLHYHREKEMTKNAVQKAARKKIREDFEDSVPLLHGYLESLRKEFPPLTRRDISIVLAYETILAHVQILAACANASSDEAKDWQLKVSELLWTLVSD